MLSTNFLGDALRDLPDVGETKDIGTSGKPLPGAAQSAHVG